MERFSGAPKLLPINNESKGFVSNKAATRIKNAVNWMLLLTDKKRIYSKKERSTFTFYLNFITLTLPEDQKHTDEELKEVLLIPFIEWMVKTQDAKMWFWKAERQSNGRIHFHITSHVFIHWKSIRKKWNYLLAKNGYYKVFQDGTKKDSVSGTDIRAAKNAEQVGSYLSKYASKNDMIKLKIRRPVGLPAPHVELNKVSHIVPNYSSWSVLKRPVDGRLWACSYNLSKINLTYYFEEWGIDGWNDLMEDSDWFCSTPEKNEFFTLYLFRHLKYVNLPTSFELDIKHIKKRINPNEKTYYTVETLF